MTNNNNNNNNSTFTCKSCRAVEPMTELCVGNICKECQWDYNFSDECWEYTPTCKKCDSRHITSIENMYQGNDSDYQGLCLECYDHQSHLDAERTIDYSGISCSCIDTEYHFKICASCLSNS